MSNSINIAAGGVSPSRGRAAYIALSVGIVMSLFGALSRAAPEPGDERAGGLCPGGGACCDGNLTPGCSDATCCDTVCAVDPFCCTDFWDGICAQEAADLCGGCVVGACCVPDIGACCCPDISCSDDILESSCIGSGCVFAGADSICPPPAPAAFLTGPIADCPCDNLPEPCLWCWLGTGLENNCPAVWEEDGECDCGCQFSDSIDCTLPREGGIIDSSKPKFVFDETREAAALRSMAQAAGTGQNCEEAFVLDFCLGVGGDWAGDGSQCTDPGVCQGGGSCGPDCSKLNVECLNPGPRYDNRTVVGRLLLLGSPICTAWIVATDGTNSVVMTNQHCVFTNPSQLVVEFNRECDACVNGTLKSTQTFPVNGLIKQNELLDYALLRVAGDPASLFGVARIDTTVHSIGLPIYEIHHAGTKAKGYDEGIVTGVGVAACVANESSVNVIASGGASGSPVFRQDNDCATAICNCGPDCQPGFVVPMSSIVPDAASSLANAGFSFTLCGGCGNAHLLESKYACDSSLSRAGDNILRFTFDTDLTGGPPAPGELLIRELLDGGAFGPDISANFVFSIEGGNTLKIEEPGQVFSNETWYAVMNTGDWCDAETFQVDYAVVYGDANNDRVTSFGDLSAINALASDPADTPDNSRFDINTDGQVSFADLSAANSFNGSSALNKPTGHGCLP